MNQKLKVPEFSVKKAVAEYLAILEKQGIVAWWGRTNAGMIPIKSPCDRPRMVRMGRKGDPDFVGFLSSDPSLSPENPECFNFAKGFAVEVKGSNGHLTEEQRETLTRIRKYGGIAVVARSVDDVEHVFYLDKEATHSYQCPCNKLE